MPLYGFGTVVLFILSEFESQIFGQFGGSWWYYLVMFFGMALAMTALEYIAGLMSLKVMHLRLWDYSHCWGNIQGLICPLFTFFWGVLSALYYFLLYPPLRRLVVWFVAHPLFSFIVGVCFGIFLIDLCFSVHLGAVVQKKAAQIDKTVYDAIDVQKLSDDLGIPVVPITAAKGEGVSELMDRAVETAKNRVLPKVYDFCAANSPVHRCVHAVVHLIEDHAERLGLPPRFCATKLIEGDRDMADRLVLDQNERELLEHCIVQMETENGLDRNASLADMRYTFIEQVTADAVVKCHESKEHKRSVAWDRVLTGKYTALPVFFGVMLLIFWLTFDVIGQGLSDLLALGIDYVTAGVDGALTAYGINPVVHSLIIDGIFAGVGSVLSFLPIIVTLFFFLSILEDTGYMARVAFVMDKLLRKIGLSGRSFVPMLVGFGCSVPAIMATRTLSSNRDRKMTILLTPFMSCSAKIPIYTLFAAAFFPGHELLVMLALYFGGILVGILVALVLKNTAFKGNPVPFVMELPNYRFPSAKSVVLLMWEKAKDFLTRAFTVIFMATVIIWFMQTFDTRLNVVENSADSILAALGRLVSPIFAPLGFGDWRMVTALVSGFTAKEAVVSTFGVILGVSTEQLGIALHSLFTTASAASFLAFCLLYTPCVAAVSTIKTELKSGWKTVGIVFAQCLVAWLAAFMVYHVGLLLT